MDDACHATDEFAPLVTQLRQRGYRTTTAGRVLLVVGLEYEGGPRRLLQVVRVPRPSDFDRWWWRIQNRAWLAEADNPVEAAVMFAEHLHPVYPPGALHDPEPSAHV